MGYDTYQEGKGEHSKHTQEEDGEDRPQEVRTMVADVDICVGRVVVEGTPHDQRHRDHRVCVMKKCKNIAAYIVAEELQLLPSFSDVPTQAMVDGPCKDLPVEDVPSASQTSRSDDLFHRPGIATGEGADERLEYCVEVEE